MSGIRNLLGRISINGRYTGRPMKGVDRVAYELTLALHRLSKEHDGDSIRLVLPKFKKDKLAAINGQFSFARLINKSNFSGHIWEQFSLPFSQIKGWTINFCNVGPLIAKKQIIFIHDAQVFLSPKSYYWKFRLWYRVCQPLLARRASILITVSNFSLKKLEHFKVFPPGKAKVIYNGVDHLARITEDLSVFKKHRISPKSYLLAFYNQKNHKNIECIITARQKFDEHFPPLVLIGDNSIVEEDNLNCANGIIYTGRVNDNELKALYSNALFFVFPSITEGFGLPPLEAMYCKCPVISSSAGALPEICGNAAYYVDPNDPLAWSKAMLTLSSEPELRMKLKLLGSQQITNYTWRKSAIKLLQIIAEFEQDSDLLNELYLLNCRRNVI